MGCASPSRPRFRAIGAVLGFMAVVAPVLAGCGNIEWPPRRPAPEPIYRPPAETARSAPRQAPATQPRRDAGSGVAFVAADAVTVGPGDTVYALSRRHRVPVRAIIEANGLKPPYHVIVGQRIELPRGRQHRVEPGDTLYAIARSYGADPYALARANGLRPPYAIKVGEVLVVTEAAKPAAPAPGAVAEARPGPKAQAPRRSTAIPRPPRRAGRGFLWPVEGRVISSFGAKAKGLRNDGINIAAGRGTPVLASENGVVAYAGNELRGFGNLLLVKHSGGWVTAYAHNDTILVKRGDRVAKGQKIATVGSTGNVRSPQLHFELRRGRTVQDPAKHLAGA